METVRPLLFPNQQLSSLKLDCGRLGNSAIDILVRPSLREISLHNCRDFTGDLISEIGRKCKDLRLLCLGSVAEKIGRSISRCALEDLLNGCSRLEVLTLMFDLSLYLRPGDGRIFGLVSDTLTHLELGHISLRMMTQLLTSTTVSGQDSNKDTSTVLQNVQQLRLSVDCITDASKMCHSCPHLHSQLPRLRFQNVSLSMETVRPLLFPNQQLSSLKLDCGRLGNSAIDILVRPSLREISLHNCRDFTGDLISEIGRKCKDLRLLCLGSVAEKIGRSISRCALEDLLNGCSRLEVLTLMFDLSLYLRPGDGRIFGLVSDTLTHLELGHISLRMMTQLLTSTTVSGQDSNKDTSTVLQNVQQLRLSVDCITDAVVKAISKSVISLIDLDLRDAPVEDPRQLSDLTDFGLQEINQNGKLKHLSLICSQEFHRTYFRRVSDQGMLFLADKCLSMESICLGGFCGVTDAGFKTIRHSCASLSKFSIYHGPKLTDLVFHDILATTLLISHVSLRRCHLLTDHAIQKLASNLKLENLDLRGCRNLRDETLQAIAHLPKLKVLLLDGTDISDTGLAYLKGVLGSLVSLSVRGCRNLTDKFMSTLFDGSSKLALRELDLSNLPNLTDAAIFALAKSGAPITNLEPQSQRRRPHLQVSCRGEELGNDGEDDWDSADIHQHIEAQEDELEQWILGDEGDVEMEDAEDKVKKTQVKKTD